MILVIDIGNTNIVMGVWQGSTLAAHWRLVTEPHRTVDEYGILVRGLFDSRGIPAGAVAGIIVSSVVPALLPVLEALCRTVFSRTPVCVRPGMDTGITVCYDNPLELGSDRLVNAVAAFETYRRGVIVIDFGTATTFDYVSPEAEYRGGTIAPGLATAAEALFQKAAQLPRVDFVSPGTVVARNTRASMQAGIVSGYVCLVEGIVRRMKDEVSDEPCVVATGGLAPVVASQTGVIDDVDEQLTLRGLKILYDRCGAKKKGT